eukprot:506534_1
MDTEALMHSMWALFFGIVAIIMLISIIQNLYCNTGKHMINKNGYFEGIRISAVLCLIGYIIRLLALSGLHVPYYCASCNISKSVWITFQLISAFTLFLNKPLTEIHFIIRLYFTFRESAFATKTFTYIILITIIIIQILCILLYFLLGLIELNGDIDSPLLVEDDFNANHFHKAFESKFCVGLLIVAVISDLIVSFIITQLFISKLFKLLVLGTDDVEYLVNDSKQQSNTNVNEIGMNEDNDIDDCDVNDGIRKYSEQSETSKMHRKSLMYTNIALQHHRTVSLINTITRYTLLSSFTMIFTQIYFIMELTHILLICFEGGYHEWLDTPLAVLSLMDAIVAISSIYLMFKFAKKWYMLICRICHEKCENICKKVAKRTIYKQYMNRDMKTDNQYSLMEE